MLDRKIVAVVNDILDIQYQARQLLKAAGNGVRLYPLQL